MPQPIAATRTTIAIASIATSGRHQGTGGSDPFQSRWLVTGVTGDVALGRWSEAEPVEPRGMVGKWQAESLSH